MISLSFKCWWLVFTSSSLTEFTCGEEDNNAGSGDKAKVMMMELEGPGDKAKVIMIRVWGQGNRGHDDVARATKRTGDKVYIWSGDKANGQKVTTAYRSMEHFVHF